MNGAAGGAALSTIGLMQALEKLGVESSAVCDAAGTPEEYNQIREATGGRVEFTPLYWWNRKIRSRAWKRPLLELRQILRTGRSRGSAKRVMRFAEKQSVNLIHTNTILTPEGGLAARSLGIPHVWHVRELLGPGQPFRLPLEGQRFGEYMRSHCSKLVANSHITASYIRSWVPTELLTVVPNGIDISRFVARTAPRGTRPFVVAMVASLTSRWKKHSVFIEAASRVSPEVPAEFRIYGHDPSHAGATPGDAYTDELHALARARGVANRLKWQGYVADQARIMSEIDVLVHPATAESFGRIVVEAMAAGVPVIGVRSGGVAEIVEHGSSGLLAEPDDADQIARYIEQVCQDPKLYSQLAIEGRMRADREYSLTSCAQRIQGIYKQSLSNYRTSSH